MNNVVITEDQVREIFQNAEHQSDYTLALYRLAFPRWDEIEEIKGWPKVSEKFSKFIFELAMEFDRKHHPKVFNGGLWMNKGFSSLDSNDVPWGTIDLSTCEVVYKQ